MTTDLTIPCKNYKIKAMMTLYHEIQKHLQKERASFHMPGHKGRDFLPHPGIFMADFFKLDTTELTGTDCLHSAEGILAEAQQRAKTLYGSEKSYFLVNGSTCGILAMFYACFGVGDAVLIDRNCHKSVINAMKIVGISPVYICPSYDRKHHLPTGINADTVEKMYQQHPHLKGVFLTSPNYYGYVSDIAAIAKIVHKRDGVLLVDEAHGAHFAFSSHFPKTALSQGADCSVMSLHKNLPSPNQTALLHRGTHRIDPTRLDEAAAMFQTTSPSYPLMIAMDAALSYAQGNGLSKTEEILSYCRPLPKLPTHDPFKIILNFTKKGLTGYQIEKLLREKFGIYAELADFHHVLLMASWGNNKEDFTLLEEAICFLESLVEKPLSIENFDLSLQEVPVLSPKETERYPASWVDLAHSEGKISKEAVSVFPPCIPILLPGERILAHHLRYIRQSLEQGGRVVGLCEGKIQILEVNL